MQLILNGQVRELDAVPGGSSVAAVVAALGMQPDRVALEQNGEIVPRARWQATPVAEGDRIEVVHFVGGGSVGGGVPGVGKSAQLSL